MSANTAIHRVAMPAKVIARNIALMPNARTMFSGHGEADFGAGQRRRIVDAVADHANPVALGVKLLDGRQLVCRQQVAFGAVDADLSSDGLGGMRIVAGEHDGLDTQRVQFGDGLPAAVLDRVRHGEQRQRARTVQQQHHGLALALQLIQLRFELRRAQAQFFDQAMIAQVVGLAINVAAHPATRQGSEPGDLTQDQPLRLAELGNGT